MRSVAIKSTRAYSAGVRRLSDATSLTLNFSTPHASVYSNKIVDKVVVPGESGEYGITAGITPIISQLAPGVVQVVHLDVSCSSFNIFLNQNNFNFNRVKQKNILYLEDFLYLMLTQ